MCIRDRGKTLETVPVNVKAAALGFSDLVLKVDRPIIDVLKVWNQMPVKKPYYRMDITRSVSYTHLDVYKRQHLPQKEPYPLYRRVPPESLL